ncbi:MAG: hypothetical protein J6S08_03435 [Duodenibacillus sp.]|nr:hypothetical protein [Duodenibacillus sp.]
MKAKPWLFLVSMLAVSTAHADLYNDTIICNLKKTSTYYEGDCYVPNQVNDLAVNFAGLNPQYAKPYAPDRRVNTRIKPSDKSVWVGAMQGRKVEDPTLFELVLNDKGAPIYGKLPYGWFNVRQAVVTDKTLSVAFDASRQTPPTDADLLIVREAKRLLAKESDWNRRCTRKCSNEDKTYSIFCAMMKAQENVLGKGNVHYRQPAMQAFRETLNTMGKGRFDKHRLMDWNNHPDTTFAEVRELFDVTEKNMLKWRKEAPAAR